MNEYEFTMSLGVGHPDIDPACSTRALGRIGLSITIEVRPDGMPTHAPLLQ